jgi:FkbM family methyltransferase
MARNLIALHQARENLQAGGSGRASARRETYSTEGEDLLIERLFYSLIEKAPDYRGFYVDIGAFDPIVSSNTYLLHRRGWRGINIDANPDAMPLFDQHRPGDINLNAAVGDEGPPRSYFKFDDRLLNGFLAQKIVDRYVAQGARLIGSVPVACQPIHQLLKRHLPDGVCVDILNIDVEFMEEEVLRRWPFGRHSPKLIVVEIPGCSIPDVMTRPVHDLLVHRDYLFHSRLWQSSIFIRGDLV